MRGQLRWAAGIMIVLGAGHLVLLVVLAGDQLAGWVDRGVWAAVPLFDLGTQPTVKSLQNKDVFWSGPGGFAVPLIVLGCLVWHLAGRGVAVPAAFGWALAIWSAVSGVLLVPSPFFVATIAGVLIISAARTSRRAAQGSSPG